ncbi:hypothetical protein CEP54_008072 [Fusarium duplospermum]|uniref:Uncharacterized protein n=1 Tax=Fusarium duplospermum TaxID=1325734 RepID=A0A428PY33_9HYPO|nr:hypothetical protein CEP54_008072 [Fusarium duplospermum]
MDFETSLRLTKAGALEALAAWICPEVAEMELGAIAAAPWRHADDKNTRCGCHTRDRLGFLIMPACMRNLEEADAEQDKALLGQRAWTLTKRREDELGSGLFWTVPEALGTPY